MSSPPPRLLPPYPSPAYSWSRSRAVSKGGVERALEFREAAAAASDLGGVHDEWLSAVDDSTAMLFDDDAATATIRLELVGAAAPSSSLSSPSSSSSSSSSEGAEAAVAEPPAAATITAMAAASAMAVAEVASTPDQTREFFLSMMTGHGGDSAADWLADVGGGGSQGRGGGMDMGIGVGVGGGIGLGVGCADDPPCMLIGGDEMLLPPEARPPWEKATTARSRFVTCESVLPLPKPQQQAQKKNLGPRQRSPASKSDQANSRQSSSTGRPRRGAGLPR